MTKIQVPEHAADGTVRMADYYELADVAGHMLPVNAATIRRNLAEGRWHGARFGGRWWMSLDDVADAVAEARGEGTYALADIVTDGETPALGVPLDADAVEDLGPIR
jgi:hypothetical protein